MSILDRYNNMSKRNMTISEFTERLTSNSDTAYDALQEATYFTCLNIIANRVATCSIDIKEMTEKGWINNHSHKLNDILKLKANDCMNIFTLLKTVVLLYKHRGIAGIYIHKNEFGKVLGLYPAEINSIIIDNKGLIKSTKNNKILINFTVDSMPSSCFEKDMILLKDFTLDGIHTNSVKNMLASTIDTNIKSQNYLNHVFSNGLTNKLAIQCTSDLQDEADIIEIQRKFDNIYSSNGRVFTIPASFSVQPLNLSLSDAQFEQLKRMSQQQIASVFGVKMHMIGDYKDSSNLNIEQENIEFLQNTLNPIFCQLEQEFNSKLLTFGERQKFKIRFNIESFFKVDKQTQANILISYVNAGIYTRNEAREILDREKLENGDNVFVASGTVSLNQLVNNEVSYVDSQN